MPKKEEFDVDKELEKISRKSNLDIRKSEYSFENQIRKLDKEIDKIMDSKIKEFDDNDFMAFPNFKKGTMYKGMEFEKKYTLEQLNI